MRSVNFFLIFVCVVTAMSVVWVRHENREAVIELHNEYEIRDDLNIEWQRLLIEQTAWSRSDQLQNWANAGDQMKAPQQEYVLILPIMKKIDSADIR